MTEEHAQTLVLAIALASVVTGFGAGLVLKRRVPGIIQVLSVSGIYITAVILSLTAEEWRDGQTAVGLLGIFLIELIAASIGYLCSRVFIRSRPGQN